MSLSTFDASLLLFSSIASGPAGIEPAIGAAGFANTIIGLLAIQLLFGGPQSVIVLSLVKETGGGHDGGVVYWSEKLIGTHAKRVMALIQLFANCATAAAVAQIAEAYVSTLLSSNDSFQDNKRLMIYGITIGAVVFAFTICSISLRSVVNACGLFSLFTFAAYTTFFATSVPKMKLHRLHPPKMSGVNWAVLFNNLIFNASGYDSAAMLGDELNPKARKNIPFVIIFVMASTSLMYTFTLGGAYLASKTSDSDWGEGHFAVVAREIGGPKLRAVIVAASLGSMFQMFTASFEIAVTSVIAGFNRTRWVTLLVTLAVSLGFCFIPVQISLAVQAVLYGVAYICEVYLYTLLKRDVNLFLYLFLAVSIGFSILIVALQPWWIIVTTLGSVAASGLLSIVH